MKAYILPEETRTAIVRYLQSRPYAEVVNGIQALMQLEEAPTSGAASGVERRPIYPASKKLRGRNRRGGNESRNPEEAD